MTIDWNECKEQTKNWATKHPVVAGCVACYVLVAATWVIGTRVGYKSAYREMNTVFSQLGKPSL